MILIEAFLFLVGDQDRLLNRSRNGDNTPSLPNGTPLRGMSKQSGFFLANRAEVAPSPLSARISGNEARVPKTSWTTLYLQRFRTSLIAADAPFTG